MWANEVWAASHIRKHGVVPREAWEVYALQGIERLVSTHQLRWPPFRRYWLVGTTVLGRRLLIVWEEHRGVKNLITAFEPNEEQVAVYERQKRQRR
jgi:hypothetical protein